MTLLADSYGKRVSGDHITFFEAGDLLPIDPNLPHYIRNDADFYQGNAELRCRAIVAHYAENFMGVAFFDKPELHSIAQLLQESQQGIHIYGDTAIRIVESNRYLPFCFSISEKIFRCAISQTMST